jgi:xanthine dehydrogenase YagR molybdenum-binding subunit
MKTIRKGRIVHDGFEHLVTAVYDEQDDQLVPWDEHAELSVVGNPLPRVDGAKRVSGAACFTVDVQLPRMLHLAILRSPVAHGRVRRLDLEAPRAAPGVRAVIGPDDVVGDGPALLSCEPQFVGAPIAALAAETLAAGQAALGLFAPEIEALPFVVDLEEGLRAQRFDGDPTEDVRGKPDSFEQGEVRVSLDVRTQFHVQSPMEPHAAVADWQEDELTVWCSTQAIFPVRAALAQRFSLDPSRVRVIAEFVGGAFGGKVELDAEALIATEISRRLRRPVSAIMTRHEEQLIGGHRAATHQTVRLAATHAGDLVASEVDCVIGMGASSGMTMPNIHGPAMHTYASRNAHVMRFPVKLNLRPINPFRAPGGVEGTTAYEQAIDELAAALATDPLELRRVLYVDHDQRDGRPYSGKSLLACYDRAAQLAGWAERDELRSRSPDGLLHGLGCATQMWFGSAGPTAECTIRIGADGVATVVTGIQEIGTGTLTSAQIVAAEELGLPLDRVRVMGGDTRPNVVAPFAAGSVTTASVTPAVRAAAASARRALLELASDIYEISPNDLVIGDGRIRSRDMALDRDYRELTSTLGAATVEGAGARTMNSDDYSILTWGCQIAQIAVDPGLGTVFVEKVAAVHDVGRIINPLLASSQVEGGIIQGVGYALTEERVIDPTTGAPANASLDDYKVPTIADTPLIVMEFIDIPDRHAANTGAKGLGEPPIIPTAAAIANAFAHATGRRCRDLPMTPARVIEALA